MLGAVAGDIIGSPYEGPSVGNLDFPILSTWSCFTDDSVMTIATASALMNEENYVVCYQGWGRQYPEAGYGGAFIHWLFLEDPQPYGSWGNGAGMRASPVGWAMNSVEEVLAAAERSASVTHDHPEGIKGAQAVALAVFLARTGSSKDVIRREITERFGYNLNRTLAEIRPAYRFDVSCQGSVPEAIISFLEAEDFESAVRNAISLNGDSDTLACMAGAIADAFYGGVPEFIARECNLLLDLDLRVEMRLFEERFVRR